MNDKNDYIYSAFISYRHVDPDQIIAKRIQRSIETFHVPAEYRREKDRKHLRKAFRDSDELSLDKDLASGIDYALSRSEFLILILTPLYKQSKWCLHEIDEFLKTHDRKNILCVLADGEPADVLPESITHIPPDSVSDEITYTEPLCADYRLDRITAERLELPRLLSSMLNCSYDDLMKRQAVYRRKRFLKISGVALITLALIIFLQVRNTLSLNKSYENTLYSQSQTLAAQSLQHLSDFNRESALSLSLLALPDGSRESSRKPVTAEALHALSKATYVYQPDALALNRRRFMQNDIVMREVSKDQSLIVTMDSTGWILVLTSEGERLSYWQIDGVDNQYLGFILQDNRTALAWRGNNFYSYDFLQYDRNWCVRIPGEDGSSGIISAELIDDSTCSVMTESRIMILDLQSGDVIRELTADSIAGQYLEDSQSSERAREDPKLLIYRQLVCSSGEFFLSGCLHPSPGASEKEYLFLAAWNPAENTLRVRTYDLPPHCLQLQAAGDDRLVGVAAAAEFDAAEVNRLAAISKESQFSYLRILCFDRGSLAIEWEYDTEAAQPLSLPRIDYYKPKDPGQAPVVSVVFDVDDYMFDLNSGTCFFALTLPDKILLSRAPDGDGSAFISFLCGDHKLYIANPSKGRVIESEGISSFPDAVQAVNMVNGDLVAFSEEYIYWFGGTDSTDNTGEIALMSEEDDLEYFDAGDNLLGCYSNSKLFIIDLQTGRTVREISLTEAVGPAAGFDWKYGGSLPGGTGFVMLCKESSSGKVQMFTYDFSKLEFALWGSLFEKASFSRGVNWADCFAYYEGILYAADPQNDNMLLYFDIPARRTGRIAVTGIPSSMKLAEAYDDYVSEYELNEATLAISPDGRKLFSTIVDPAARKGDFAVIDLETGACSIPAAAQGHPGRSYFGAFSQDGLSLACSTDYAVFIFNGDYSAPVRVPTNGLNVRTMTWFEGDLWIEFSNFIVRHYNKEGLLISEIELDHADIPHNGQSPQWTGIFGKYDKPALMLIDEGNMNLISTDDYATTPILHIPGFVGWNNEKDSFIVRSYRTSRYREDDTPYSHIYITYPHYTTEELIKIGSDQYKKLAKEQEN